MVSTRGGTERVTLLNHFLVLLELLLLHPMERARKPKLPLEEMHQASVGGNAPQHSNPGEGFMLPGGAGGFGGLGARPKAANKWGKQWGYRTEKRQRDGDRSPNWGLRTYSYEKSELGYGCRPEYYPYGAGFGGQGGNGGGVILISAKSVSGTGSIEVKGAVGHAGGDGN